MALNSKGKPFSWSYTAMSQFKNCQAQYAAERFYCTVPFVQSAEAKEGDMIHKALENALKTGEQLPDWCRAFTKYVDAVRRRAEKTDADILVEEQITLARDMSRTGWFDKDAWCRGKIDVLLMPMNSNECTIIDWKTGKVSDDPLQLRMFAKLATFINPNLERFKCKYIWLKHDRPTEEILERETVERAWKQILEVVAEMEACWESEAWGHTKSGLCNGWCKNHTCHLWRPRKI